MTQVLSSGEAVASDPLVAVKTRQQAMWASGDYAVIGTTLQIVGELLAEAADVRGGEQVLDVAAGNGNATLAAARRFASVTSTDYVPDLLERGRLRAEAEGHTVAFEVADVEALQYQDESFDVVLSTFGAMFAPNHQKTASEMNRVCRTGGRIGLANWTPTGFIGKLFRLVGSYVAPPPNVQSPILWGTESHVRELFPTAAAITHTPRLFAFRYQSPEHFLNVFRSYYGPVHKAFAALDAAKQQAFEADMLELLRSHNRSGDASLVIPSEYLETVITK